MASKLCVQYTGAIYHVLNHGDRRELIFRDDPDRQRFLDTLAQACIKTGWQVHTYWQDLTPLAVPSCCRTTTTRSGSATSKSASCPELRSGS